MENIFIFIVIMIISGILSKKKKQAQQTVRPVEKTTHYDENGNAVERPGPKPKPSTEQKLSDLLEKIGMIEKQTDEAVEATEEEIYQMEYEYNENDYSEPKVAYETGSSVSPEGEERISVHSSEKLRYSDSSVDYSIKNAGDNRLRKLFDSRSKLKRAVVISEIFNRKY